MKKKILVVSNMYPSKRDVSYGTFVKNIVQSLDKEPGIEITLSVIRGRSNLVVKLLKYIYFILNTVRLVLIGNYDKIYIHYISHSYLPILLVDRFIKSEIVVHVHGGDVVKALEVSNFFFKIKQSISVRALSNANRVFVPSKYYSNILIEGYMVDRNKIIVYPSGGVNRQLFNPHEENNNKKLTLGYVGRLTESKGIPLLLETVKKLVMSNIYIDLILVGTGALEKHIKTFIFTEQLSEQIKLLPPVPQKELPLIYSKMDLFIFPTMFESLGLVGLEAMACGVPVIGSRVGGLNDYIFDGINGYFFECGNTDDLVDKIVTFNDLSVIEKKNLIKGALQTASKYDSETVNDLLKKEFI